MKENKEDGKELKRGIEEGIEGIKEWVVNDRISKTSRLFSRCV